jgi:hypothetical protein
MKIAILSNPIVVGVYWELFPNTSFTNTGPTDEFLAENNAKQINMTKSHNPLTEKLESCDPYEEGSWVYIVRVVALTEEEIQMHKNSLWNNIRGVRNDKMSASDWTQLPDSPLTSEKKLEWATYRQALRDITNQNIDPRVEGAVWPFKPA